MYKKSRLQTTSGPFLAILHTATPRKVQETTFTLRSSTTLNETYATALQILLCSLKQVPNAKHRDKTSEQQSGGAGHRANVLDHVKEVELNC